MRLKLLHTSDWHIGRLLYGRKRYEEIEAFLTWLIEQITLESIDILLVAGDIFDTTTPSHHAQTLYYQFLTRVAQTCCRHVVIIAGNHDAPSLINAPKSLLLALNIHVVGQVTDQPEDALILLRDAQQSIEAMVCALPYLRDKDIRTVAVGESLADKDQKRLAGIQHHYQQIGQLAEQVNARLTTPVPVIGMGHLFTAGGATLEGDGVRDLYVGSLAHIHASVFPAVMDYVALGHLHLPQQVGGSDRIRYSGSPIPMGFGEATQQKSICCIEMIDKQPVVRLIPIPRFQSLIRVSGNHWEEIETQLQTISQTTITQTPTAWVEVIYTGNTLIADLRERVEQKVAGSRLEVLRIRNHLILQQALRMQDHTDSLDSLTTEQVFERCLTLNLIPEAQQAQLKHRFAEILMQFVS